MCSHIVNDELWLEPITLVFNQFLGGGGEQNLRNLLDSFIQ